MPTPTVPRSRSPAPDTDTTSPSRSHSTTLPVTIPGSALSEHSKLPTQDAFTASSSSSSSSNAGDASCPIASDTDNALAASPSRMSTTTDRSESMSRPESTVPLDRRDELAADSNPALPASTATRQSLPATRPVNHLPPSLTPRPWEFAGPSTRPTITSAFLRPYSRFVGKQRSDKNTYNVEVELKYVDMAQSTLSGFLRIEGLTEHLPTITTYFTGELIGTHYTFSTLHPTWGATEKTDLAHWSRFREFSPISPLVRAAGGSDYRDPHWRQHEHIFMRWKEQFLVPDHRRTDLPGASFEGFYYIVFNQRTGGVSGIYFHSRSEKYQKLELECVTGRRMETGTGLGGRGLMGAPPAIAFR